MKSRRTVLALAMLVLAPSALVPGCANEENNKWLGAGIGAGVGVLAGRALAPKGSGATGAILGGVIGGVAGYAIAGGFGSKATEEQKKSPEFKQASSEFDQGVEAKKAGNDQAALGHYTKASQLAPDQPESYNNAGLIYLERGDKGLAEANFRKALEVDPKFEPARTNLEKMGLTP
jgi:tetratricopeptide (TPR) repeat protein